MGLGRFSYSLGFWKHYSWRGRENCKAKGKSFPCSGKREQWPLRSAQNSLKHAQRCPVWLRGPSIRLYLSMTSLAIFGKLILPLLLSTLPCLPWGKPHMPAERAGTGAKWCIMCSEAPCLTQALYKAPKHTTHLIFSTTSSGYLTL